MKKEGRERAQCLRWYRKRWTEKDTAAENEGEILRYEFTITIAGYGKNPDEAWRDACEGFELDWGETPEEFVCYEDE